MKRTIDYIEKIVCAVRGTTPEQLRERTDNGKLTRCTASKESRQIVMYFALENGHTQWAASGYYKQHHCTALHSRNHLGDLLLFERNLSDEIDVIRTVLKDEDLYREYMGNIILSKLKRAYVALGSEKIAV